MRTESPDQFPISETPRRVGIYPVIDRYVFREFMLPFLVLILAFLIMFLIGDVFNDLQDFLDHKAPLGTILRYFMLKMPGNIRFILPISILLACMYTMANFGKHMEVTAMRSSGVSLMRCGASIFMVGIFITLLNFFFNEQLVPYTERSASMLINRVSRGDKYVERIYRMLTYRSPDMERTWLFKFFDSEGNHQDVIVKKNRPDGTLEWDINAASAKHTADGWIFREAVVTAYSKDGLLPKSPVRHEVYSLPLETIPDDPRDISNAVREPEELPSWTIIEMLMRSGNMGDRCRAIYLTILYSRLAFPWACVLAVFLGIPLATKNERSGIFMAIITALAVIVGYKFSSEIFVIFGKQGFLWPSVAGLAPSVFFFIYGWYNVSRRI